MPIHLEKNVYFPGDVVAGHVTLSRPLKEKEDNRIQVSLIGKLIKVCGESEDVTHLKKKKTCVVVVAAAAAGQPFSFELPSDCPPTYRSEHVNVIYFIRMKLLAASSDDVTKDFIVAPCFDVTQIPNVESPVTQSVVKRYGWIGNRGTHKLTATITGGGGFVIGDAVHVTTRFENSNNTTTTETTIHKAKAQLIQVLTWKDSIFGNEQCRVLIEKKRVPVAVPPGAILENDWLFSITPMPHTIRHPPLITVDYFVEIAIGKTRLTLPIVIGTRPDMPKIYFSPDV